MHARAVIAEDGFGHEGCALPVRVGDVFDDMFIELNVIGAGGQGGVFDS